MPHPSSPSPTSRPFHDIRPAGRNAARRLRVSKGAASSDRSAPSLSAAVDIPRTPARLPWNFRVWPPLSCFLSEQERIPRFASARRSSASNSRPNFRIQWYRVECKYLTARHPLLASEQLVTTAIRHRLLYSPCNLDPVTPERERERGDEIARNDGKG